MMTLGKAVPDITPDQRRLGDGPRLYVRGLDERMSRPVPRGSIVLVSGTPGTLKTSFCLNTLYWHAVETGEKVLYLSLEQSAADLLEQMTSIGYDLDAVRENLRVIDLAGMKEEFLEAKRLQKASLTPVLLKWSGKTELVIDPNGRIDWMGTILAYRKVMRAENYTVVCMDSLDALYTLTASDGIRDTLYGFFSAFRRLGMTVFLISEMRPGSEEFGRFGEEAFLADGIIHLKTERKERSVGRYISIVKMRKVAHPMDYYPLVVESPGFSIVLR